MVLIDTLREQWDGLTKLDEQIAVIERRLRQWMLEDKAIKAITAIPGVGVLTATAAVATMGDAKSFGSWREFAAWIGLVPKQTGSGGKVTLLGISKRGDTYLRTLLIHGARSVLHHVREPGPWVEEIRKRRPSNVVIVALANKMARTIWAILAHDIPVLAPLIEKEFLYRLMTSEQGKRLRQIAVNGSQTYRIARAIEWIQNHYTELLRVEMLAQEVNMSVSSLHHHFKTVTMLSPLQYQKQLRLHEARKLLLRQHGDVGSVAIRVGYDSPSQFSREYSRLFGAPPLRDVVQLSCYQN
jgi:AraC-like DNA-binding protein